MATIRHIAITSENPFVTGELMERGFGLKQAGRGDSELAREVYFADGYINLALVCWKRAGVKLDLSSQSWPVASE